MKGQKSHQIFCPMRGHRLITINQGHQQGTDKRGSISLSSVACLLQAEAVDRRRSSKAGFINSLKDGRASDQSMPGGST